MRQAHPKGGGNEPLDRRRCGLCQGARHPSHRGRRRLADRMPERSSCGSPNTPIIATSRWQPAPASGSIGLVWLSSMRWSRRACGWCDPPRPPAAAQPCGPCPGNTPPKPRVVANSAAPGSCTHDQSHASVCRRTRRRRCARRPARGDPAAAAAGRGAGESASSAACRRRRAISASCHPCAACHLGSSNA